MNKAVTLNSKSSMYKYILASFVYNYCSKNTELKPEIKINLLKQAEEELIRAQPTEYSALQRDAMLSMIYYEMGRVEESDKLKNEVFKYDSLMFPLRNSLAYNYFKSGNYEKMSNELNFILKYDPGNIDALFTYEYYYFKMNDLEKAKEYCEKILKLDPQNKAAKRMFEEIKNRQK
jgi:tetratricopeptide (TPR) repeat protein